jgi:hypothetical protein
MCISPSLKICSIAALSALSVSFGWAATASSAFNVTVQPIGVCISTTLSQQTNALVKVTCQGGQFVSIEPREGRPFVGVHGGAYRFAFGRNTAIPAFLQGDSDILAQVGQGTITALRVLNLTERDERLELLVSFGA